MSELADLTRDYRVAFQRFLPQRSEAALTEGYDLGRRAIVLDISLLDLVQVHHVILAEILEDSPDGEKAIVTSAASEFLLEVLATFDMTHRRLRATQSGVEPAP